MAEKKKIRDVLAEGIEKIYPFAAYEAGRISGRKLPEIAKPQRVPVKAVSEALRHRLGAEMYDKTMKKLWDVKPQVLSEWLKSPLTKEKAEKIAELKGGALADIRKIIEERKKAK